MKRKSLIFQCIAASFAILFVLSIYVDPHVEAEALGAWTANNGAATAAGQQSCVLNQNQNYIFCATVSSNVYFNTYSLGVVGGSWTATNAITSGNAFNYPWDCQGLGNVILCVSRNPSGAGSCVAYYATMTATGVSGWTSTSAPGSDYCPGGLFVNANNCGIFNGFEYCAGNGGAGANLQLTAASVTANGFGTWAQTTQAIANIPLEACTVGVTTAALYCVGGSTGSRTNAAAYCPIGNGIFGTCHTGPLFSAANYPVTVQDLYCFTNFNYLYCVGGNDGTNYLTAVYYAPITTTSVGAWISTNNYGNAASKLGCTLDGNAVVTCLGGFNGAGLSTGFYSTIIVGVSTSTSTTTVNTGCTGNGCSGGANSTGNYLTTNTFYYYWSQNQASPGQIDNVTIKVAAVHINSASTNLQVITYEASNSAPPSATNPWVLVSPTTLVPLTNGTTVFFVHSNPQTLICSACFYAVGVMATSTKSNSASVTGSGISIYETSTVGFIEYQFAQGGSTPQASFFANTPKTSNHFDFMYIHITYPVAISTTTVTSTIAINGTVTSTTLLTSTVTTIDSTFFLQNANFPLMMFVLLLPAGMLLGVTKDLTGTLVGLLIGAAAIAVLIPPLRFIFLGLVLAIVALAYMVRNRG